MTEADIRRIVREEIAEHDQRKRRQNMSITIAELTEIVTEGLASARARRKPH